MLIDRIRQPGNLITEIHADETDGGKIVIHSMQDCAALLREVEVERHRLEYFGTKASPFIPVAKIPKAEIERAIREGWFDDDAAWVRWINDRDNRKWRIVDRDI
jgi:hypothetical protein